MRRNLLLVSLFCLLLFFSACRMQGTDESVSSPDTGASSVSQTDSEDPESSHGNDVDDAGDGEASKSPEESRNPLRLTDGYTVRNETDENGFTLLAVLDSQARNEEGNVHINGFHALTDGTLLIDYLVYPQGTDGGADPEEYIVRYDRASDTVRGALDIRTPGCYAYPEYRGRLWKWSLGDTFSKLTGYDESLTPCANLFFQSETGGPYLVIAPDAESVYALEGRSLLRHPVLTEQDTEKVVFDTAFAPEGLYGVFPNAQGEDLAFLQGVAGDLYSYYAVANLDRGELLYLGNPEGSLYVENNMLIRDESWIEPEDPSDSQRLSRYTIYASGGLYRYTFSSYHMTALRSLERNLALFYRSEDDTSAYRSNLTLWLYDAAKGEALGASSLTANLGYANLSLCVPLPGEDAVLLALSEESEAYGSNRTFFYRWDYTRAKDTPVTLPEVEAQPADTGLLDTIASDWDPTLFVPGSCPEELMDLRARADQLEERFGVGIRISEECRDMIGGYAIVAMSERDPIEASLNMIEYELAKYPDGFLEQLQWEGIQGIDLYLSGALIGMNEEMLSTAGGVTTDKDGRLIIAIDITSPEALPNTLHHEIAHAIDHKLQADYERDLLSETAWDQLNPSPNLYSYSYRNYEDCEYPQYIYGYGENADEVYYIDAYSLTYPTEDRARIFEHIMVDDSFIDFSLYPHLAAKLRFYCDCIREGFTDTGWESPRWERLE